MHRHTSTPDKLGMQNELPLHAKTWPKALSHSLSLSHSSYLSLSHSIHLFQLSRRYQLEETDVSSCFTSWLNFLALWCFLLEWRPVSLLQERPSWQIPADFKSLCSLATEDGIVPPHLRAGVLGITNAVMPPLWRLLPSLTRRRSGGGGVTSGFECPSGRWWDRTMEWGGWGYD